MIPPVDPRLVRLAARVPSLQCTGRSVSAFELTDRSASRWWSLPSPFPDPDRLLVRPEGRPSGTRATRTAILVCTVHLRDDVAGWKGHRGWNPIGQPASRVYG